MLNVKNKIDSDTSTTTQTRMKAGTATEKPTTVTRVSDTASQVCDICKSKIPGFYEKRVHPSVSSARSKYEDSLFMFTLMGSKIFNIYAFKVHKNKDMCLSQLAESPKLQLYQIHSRFKWNFQCSISIEMQFYMNEPGFTGFSCFFQLSNRFSYFFARGLSALKLVAECTKSVAKILISHRSKYVSKLCSKAWVVGSPLVVVKITLYLV